MIALGWLAVAVAVVLVLAEAHLPAWARSGAIALVALVCGVAFLLIGATTGLIAALIASVGVSVAWVGGLVLLARNLRPDRRVRSRAGTAAMVGQLTVKGKGESTALTFVDSAPCPLDLLQPRHNAPSASRHGHG